MKNSNLIKIVALTLLIQAFSTAEAQAQNGGIITGSSSSIRNEEKSGQVGAGLQLGGLSGFTIEYWNTPNTTLDFSLLAGGYSWGVGLSHNWFFRGAFSGRDPVASSFTPYVGAGILAGFGRQWDYLGRYGDSTFLAAQMPFGIEFLPRAERFSIYGEIVPAIEVTPAAVGFVSGDIGGRFYF